MKNEISYKEYKEALLTVDLFHAQIDEKYQYIDKKENKTDLRAWIAKTEIVGRLRNVLVFLSSEHIYKNQYEHVRVEGKIVKRKAPDKIVPPVFNYLEDVNKADFLRCRNAGKKSWNYFKELRGY